MKKIILLILCTLVASVCLIACMQPPAPDSITTEEPSASPLLSDAAGNITLALAQGENYIGAVNTDNSAQNVSVCLDKKSIWSLSGDSYVTILVNADETCANILSNGYNIYYDVASSENAWLGGGTVSLTGGGVLAPAP